MRIVTPAAFGTVGVALLLIAFVLNLSKTLVETSRTYLVMNFAGASLAAWYALATGAIPFVVLESVWALSALLRLILPIRKGASR